MATNHNLNLPHSNKQMAEICQQLLEDSQITFFAHLRKHEDGGISLLSNHPEWHLHCFQREYCILHEAIADMHKLTPHYSIWSAEHTDRPLQVIYHELRIVFGIQHGITIMNTNIKPTSDKEQYNFFLFASEKDDSELTNYYINNTEKLETFIEKYLLNADELIKQAENCKFYSPEECVNAEQYTANKAKVARIQRNKRPILSKRELECALHCKEGRSAKETAEILNLSRRTVEYYLEKVKIKLDCSSKYELITKLYDQNILPRKFNEA